MALLTRSLIEASKGKTPVPPQTTTTSSGSKASTSYGPPAPSNITPTPPMPTYTPQYQQGNPYNEILFSKQTYEAPGASSGSQAWASNNATQYYNMLGADEAAKVRNMNAAELAAYMAPKPQTPTPTLHGPPAPTQPQSYNPQPTTTPTPPMPSNSIVQTFNRDQLAQDIQSQIQRQIDERKRIAENRVGQLNTQYDRNNRLIGENRVLQDTQFARQANPFSGKTSYDKAVIGRERSIQDQQSADDLNTRIGQENAELDAFLKAAPDMQREMLNEAIRNERQWALNLANLTGNIEGQRTLAGQQFDFNKSVTEAGLTGNYKDGRTLQGQQFDWQKDPNNPSNKGQELQNQGQAIANQMNQIKLSNLPNDIKQQADLFAQQYEKGQIDLDTAKYSLQQLQDPNSPINQAKQLDLQLKQMEVEYMPQEQKLRLQQLQKQIAQIGAAPYRSATEIEMDNVKLQTAREQLKQLQTAGTPSARTAEDYSKYIDGAVLKGKDDLENPYIMNKSDIEGMILSSGLSESEMVKLYQRYGIPLK